MKKVFMTLAIVAAMASAVACSCNNNKKTEGCCEKEAVECCGDKTNCADCDKHPEGCDKQCEGCDKHCGDCEKQCDSTSTCDSSACCK